MIYIEKELDDLKKEVLEMWDLVNSQLNRAGEALLSMDKELAHEVTYREKRVNAFELKIDSDCEDIIGLYNPVALDLRFTLAEVNIESELFEKTGIKEMLDIVKAMMLQAENALIEEKSSEAIAVFNKDNRVDELNHAAVPIIAEYLQQFPERAIECLNLISIIRRLERIGDHCNNIAEEIVFYLDAKILKHAGKRS